VLKIKRHRLITNELARVSRYNLDLSLLILKLSTKEETISEEALDVVGKIIKEQIRTMDYFGVTQANETDTMRN